MDPRAGQSEAVPQGSRKPQIPLLGQADSSKDRVECVQRKEGFVHVQDNGSHPNNANE
jgi:hypothetical protein